MTFEQKAFHVMQVITVVFLCSYLAISFLDYTVVRAIEATRSIQKALQGKDETAEEPDAK